MACCFYRKNSLLQKNAIKMPELQNKPKLFEGYGGGGGCGWWADSKSRFPSLHLALKKKAARAHGRRQMKVIIFRHFSYSHFFRAAGIPGTGRPKKCYLNAYAVKGIFLGVCMLCINGDICSGEKKNMLPGNMGRHLLRGEIEKKRC